MKLNVATKPVERIGAVSEAKDFGIKKTGKAFQVLASKLYKNKIAAAIRELSANAYDSHVAVWQSDRPFEVHLPTVFEPHFAIRDYGTGLTHDAVETVFTTFFESTKEDSNDFIGALGLGCKSPFSYVDSFVVYTYDGTHRRTYECFIENQFPRLSHIATVPSNEEIGVEITFAVQVEDCDKFAQEARTIYQWFRKRPTLTGNVITVPDMPALRGSCWCLTPRTLGAVMGQVRYPIDPAIVGTTLTNLTIHFDIGEIDVQAGREELSYDKDTIAAIQARLATVEAEAHAIYKKLFRGCKNVFEANMRVARFSDQLLVQTITPKWKGMSITGSLSVAMQSLGRLAAFGDKEVLDQTHPNDMVICVYDVERTSVKRINLWKQGAGKGRVGYVMTPVAHVPIERVVEPFGDMEVVLASSIPLPARKAKLRVMGRHFLGYEIRNKPEQEIDLNEGGVFILSKNLNALDPKDESRTIPHSILQPLHRIMIDEVCVADGPRDVVIVPWSRRTEVGEGWTDIYSIIANLYAEHQKDRLFRERVIRARHFHQFSNNATDAVVGKIKELIGDRLKDGPVKSFIDDWNRCRDAHTTHDRWRVYETLMASDPVEYDRLSIAWAALKRDFPLLMDVCRQRSGSDRVQNIVGSDLALYVEAKTRQLAK